MADKPAKKRPGVRDERKYRQPLQIDRLPETVHQEIRELYNGKGKTWTQIEELSCDFVKWQDLDPEVAALFAPEFKLPKTSLHRWYYIDRQRIQDQVIEEGDAAARLAEVLAGKPIEGVNDAVVNALTREVFNLVKTNDPKERAQYMGWLQEVTLSMSRVQRIQLAQRKVDADIARSEAQRAQYAAEAGDPKEIYLKAAKDVIQKLRTREKVRVVIDTISDELITEIAHAAESFKQQVETQHS
ncbi:phage protein Gp27 family protein [Terriglobus sp. RCC_193]|uniref:phage protein Gp27 family protein n=1 Tax=Terriglobus sp. RCC_193 TaxID=3239218 RepID=UPI00352341AF